MIIADDYGSMISHDLVILELLNLEKIDGTSILINHISSESIKLIKNREKGMVGLHLDINISPFMSLFVSTNVSNSIEKEIRKQIANYKNIFNELPHFIDGHRHVQTYFNVQDILIKVLEDVNYRGFVRVSAEDITIKNLFSLFKRGAFIKGIFVSLLSISFAKKLKRKNIKHNNKFVGFYDLTKNKRTKISFNEILNIYNKEYLCMVHPGTTTEFKDSAHLSENRKIETELLKRNIR